MDALAFLRLNDAALVAVELRAPRSGPTRDANQLLVAIDSVLHAIVPIVGHHEEAAVLKGFGWIAPGDKHRRAQHLGIPGEAELDRSAHRHVWRSGGLARARRGSQQGKSEAMHGLKLSH